MTKREKILGGLVAASVAAFGVSYFWSGYQEDLSQRRGAVNSAEQELAKANMTINGGTHAMNRLSDWQEKSLPTNRDVALSLYRSWLLSIAKDAGLAIDDIKVDPRTTVSPAFRTIGYSIEAKGQLGAIASFLHSFYSRGLLQQITRLNLQGGKGSSDLIISMQVEAMLLPGATHTTDLPDGEADRLELATLEDYKTRLSERDIFSVYTPPRPPSPPPVARERPAPPQFDHLKFARFTGIVGLDDQPQAWIWVQTTDERLYLSEGETLKIGDFEATIKEIMKPNVLVLQAGEEEIRVKLGDYLRPRENEDGGS